MTSALETWCQIFFLQLAGKIRSGSVIPSGTEKSSCQFLLSSISEEVQV